MFFSVFLRDLRGEKKSPEPRVQSPKSFRVFLPPGRCLGEAGVVSWLEKSVSGFWFFVFLCVLCAFAVKKSVVLLFY